MAAKPPIVRGRSFFPGRSLRGATTGGWREPAADISGIGRKRALAGHASGRLLLRWSKRQPGLIAELAQGVIAATAAYTTYRSLISQLAYLNGCTRDPSPRAPA